MLDLVINDSLTTLALDAMCPDYLHYRYLHFEIASNVIAVQSLSCHLTLAFPYGVGLFWGQLGVATRAVLSKSKHRRFALEAVSRASCPESSRRLFVNICGCTRASAEYWFNVRHPSTINPLCLHLFKPQSVFQ